MNVLVFDVDHYCGDAAVICVKELPTTILYGVRWVESHLIYQADGGLTTTCDLINEQERFIQYTLVEYHPNLFDPETEDKLSPFAVAERATHVLKSDFDAVCDLVMSVAFWAGKG